MALNRLEDLADRLDGGPPAPCADENEGRLSSFFFIALGEEGADEVLGDLDEVYWKECAKRGGAYASRRYMVVLLGLIAQHLVRAAVRFALRNNA